MRLLVIEDNRELADLMKEKLSGFGYSGAGNPARERPWP